MKKTRTRKGSDRRSEIVEAAARLLIEKGYSGLSMRELASSLAMSVGNLQYYFPSKDALVENAFISSLNAIQVHVDNYEPTGDNIEEQLFNLALLVLDDFRGSFGTLFIMIASLALHNSDFIVFAQRAQQRSTDTAKRSFAKVAKHLSNEQIAKAAEMITVNSLGLIHIIQLLSDEQYQEQRLSLAGRYAEQAQLILGGVDVQ